MKVPPLSTLALCSLVLGKVYASESSSESAALISPNEMAIENVPAFFADRFSIDGLELVEAKPEELEWFQGLTALTDQSDVEVALAIGLVMQEAFSGDVKMAVLKHVSTSFDSLPKDIKLIAGGRIFYLAVDLKDFESCTTLLINNPSFFRNRFNSLSLESSSEIIKLIFKSDHFADVLEEIVSDKYAISFDIIYSGIAEDLFRDGFIEAIDSYGYKLLLACFKRLFTAISRIDKMQFIERFLPILENIKSDSIVQNNSEFRKILQTFSDFFALYYKILKSSETRVFQEIIQSLNLKIDESNDPYIIQSLKVLVIELSTIDLDSFFKVRSYWASR